MFFVDKDHILAFQTLVQKFKKSGDKEYLTAYYVLTADKELRKKAASQIKPDGIYWPYIWKQDWSSGYRLLLELTYNLFSYSGYVNLVYGLTTWDNTLTSVAIQAIKIRKYGITGEGNRYAV